MGVGWVCVQGHRFTAQALEQDEKHNGSFFLNPSPPSTGRRPASSQRHHCSATLSACFSMATDALFVSSRMTPMATATPSLSRSSDEGGAHPPFVFLAHVAFSVRPMCFTDGCYSCIDAHCDRDTGLSVNEQSVVPTSRESQGRSGPFKWTQSFYTHCVLPRNNKKK